MKPKLHFFNPGHETAILHDAEIYTPTKNVQRMMNDLAALPLWYADKGDFVWLPHEYSRSFSSQLPLGITPNGMPLTSSMLYQANMADSPLFYTPWGLSPHSISVAEKIKTEYSFPLDVPQWEDEYKKLTSRHTAALCLELLRDYGIEIPFVPKFFKDINEVENHLATICLPVMIKTPFSSSGRGLLRIKNPEFHYKEKEWMVGALRRQREVSVEPLLEKVQDFALEFRSDGQQIHYEGLSCFESVAAGAYSGNKLDTQDNLTAQLCEMCGKEVFRRLILAVKKALAEIFLRVAYVGFLGVDMMIYRHYDGDLHIHPCVEINMRNTMGMMSIKLYEDYISPGAKGNFLIEYFKEKGQALQFNDEMQQKYPLCLKEGKIISGYLSLIPVTATTHYASYILIR